MKIRKYLFLILFCIGILFLFNTDVFAGSLELRNLRYDVLLNEDGTANVTETWRIDIENTNTLFKTFEIDSSKYSGITNVSVVEITSTSNKSFKRIYTEKYHVDKDAFYALTNSKGQFEIAWGVDESSAIRTFKINYTIIDAVKNYNDCSEFYWQFISTDSAIPARNVTGTVTLPNSVTNLDDFRVWAHGPLNGNISRVSNSQATFEVSNLSSYTMLEVRVVTPTYVFANNLNTSSQSKSSYILSQEQKWADEANAQREYNEKIQKLTNTIIISIFVISNIVGIFIAIILIKKYKKYKLTLQETPNIVPTNPSKYYRDLPNEDLTPAQAGFLYYFKNSSVAVHIPKVISATILDLCLKKYLEFEITGNGKNDIKIKLNSNMDKNLLQKDELIILDLLEKIAKNNEFTMKDFEKYSNRNSTKMQSLFNSIEPVAKKIQTEKRNYDNNFYKLYNSWMGKFAGFVFLTILSPIFMILAFIPSILCAVYAYKIGNRYNTLTQKGTDEKEALNGLKNYMQDFSMMNQKEIPELILWEKYLIYATVFGIADKVLKQLKISYPQLSDYNYMHSHGYTYLYWMAHSNINTGFMNTINTSVNNSYNSVNYSSGGGSGGGFSGGGGFGGGGGRNGWKIIRSSCLIIYFMIL